MTFRARPVVKRTDRVVRCPGRTLLVNLAFGLAERGRDVSFHDPHIARLTDAAGVERLSTPLDVLLEGSDAVVAVTGHDAVDWSPAYADNRPVVDKSGSVRGRAVDARQVLRLGTGWTTSPN